MSSIIEQEQNMKRLIQALHINQLKDHLYFKHSVPYEEFNPVDEKQRKIISEFNIPTSYKISRDYKFSKKSFKCISSYTLFIFVYDDERHCYQKDDAIEFHRIDDLVLFLANRLE